MKTKAVLFILTLFITTPMASAQSHRRSSTHTTTTYSHYDADIDTHWGNTHSPWDFAALLGFYNPGTGFGGRAAYRVLDNVLPNVDDSLSVESGLGIISVSDSTPGGSYSITIFEIPILARWDFRIPDTKLILSGTLGFDYLSGGTVTINGQSYAVRGGTVYVQIGGVGQYMFNENWGARLGLAVGGFTLITLGGTYAL